MRLMAVACRPDETGALVLSEFTGARHDLQGAFACNPHDIDDMKARIIDAVVASPAIRGERMRALRRPVAAHDVHRWTADYLEALARAPARPPGPV